MQGDVVGIYDANGTKLAYYTYDAWGNFTTAYYSGAPYPVFSNPFTYRGYYYDRDLGLYYLNSRYYDSNTCRFVNADAFDVITATPGALTDKNLYAYCDNNPIMRVDGDGEFWLGLAIGALVGAVSQYVSDVVCNVVSGKTGVDILKPSSSVVDYVAAAASGAIASTAIGKMASRVVNAAIDSTAYAINQSVKGEEINEWEFIGTAFLGGLVADKGINSSKLRGIAKHSKEVLETAVSPRKIARYTSKISGVKKTVGREIKKTITSSAVSGAVSGILTNLNSRLG